jgi:hypothetical protein
MIRISLLVLLSAVLCYARLGDSETGKHGDTGFLNHLNIGNRGLLFWYDPYGTIAASLVAQAKPIYTDQPSAVPSSEPSAIPSSLPSAAPSPAPVTYAPFNFGDFVVETPTFLAPGYKPETRAPVTSPPP